MKPFAFISYSRYDADIAIDLHRKIERYVYPNEWVTDENRPEKDKYVRPVFLDLVDLSVKHRSFTEEIKERLASSRYLIVLCSSNSAKSYFVKREIDYFLKTHNNDDSLIVAVYIDLIFHGMHPVIDEIVASRNCPIYVTGRGEAGHVGRKYCLYHLLEFLLKVDFDKLYNRYEAYKQKKHRIKIALITSIFAVIVGVLLFGWYEEKEKAKIEHARVEFEMGVFPYSLVVGFVDNFLNPTIQSLNDSCEIKPHVIILMPKDSIELDHNVRHQIYTDYLKKHYEFEGYKTETIHIPGRNRGSSITKIIMSDCDIPIYKDDARTVAAFKYVIDYKLGKDNPVEVPKEIRDSFTINYTNKFIEFAKKSIGEDSMQVHFVKDTIEFQQVLNIILQKKM